MAQEHYDERRSNLNVGTEIATAQKQGLAMTLIVRIAAQASTFTTLVEFTE